MSGSNLTPARADQPTGSANTVDQLRINGSVDSQPRTWDGEPLWCPDTVREGLFDPEPFAQIPGQLAIDAEAGER